MPSRCAASFISIPTPISPFCETRNCSAVKIHGSKTFAVCRLKRWASSPDDAPPGVRDHRAAPLLFRGASLENATKAYDDSIPKVDYLFDRNRGGARTDFVARGQSLTWAQVTKNAYRKSSTSFGCFVALRRRCQPSMRSYWPCQPGLLCKLHGSSGGGG